jgi:hypothetical protein
MAKHGAGVGAKILERCGESFQILPGQQEKMMIKVYGAKEYGLKIHVHKVSGVLKYAQPGKFYKNLLSSGTSYYLS